MKIKDLIAELESALHAKGNVEVIIVHPDDDYYDYYSNIELAEPTPWDMNKLTWRGLATSTESSDYLLIY